MKFADDDLNAHQLEQVMRERMGDTMTAVISIMMKNITDLGREAEELKARVIHLERKVKKLESR